MRRGCRGSGVAAGQSTSRRAGEAGAAGGGVCLPVRELSVCDGGTWLARLGSRGERAAGVGARQGLCEGMRAWRRAGDRQGFAGAWAGVFWGFMLRGGGRYEGDYLNGQRTGQGIETSPDGSR